jgi:hypothetical protein
MLIKNIYAIDLLPTHNLIITPDGKAYMFYITPYRRLTEKDLVELTPAMPIEMYLKAVGARAFPAFREEDIAAYGLQRV